MTEVVVSNSSVATDVDTKSHAVSINSEPERGPTVKRLRDLKKSSRDQFMIDPRIIKIEDGHNPRNYELPENRAHLDDLKASIRENGTLTPLQVRYDAHLHAAILVDGECRLRANLELITEGVEIEAVPVIQVGGHDPAHRLLMAIVANQSKPLSELELGEAFRKLYRYGWSEDKIATKSGKSVSFVKKAMELSDAPDEVKAMVVNREVTPALAVSELRRNGSEAVESLKELADAARADGKQIATRQRGAGPSTLSVFPAARAIFKEVTGADLENEYNDYISVCRLPLLELYKLIMKKAA